MAEVIKIVTGKVRASYANVFVAKAITEGSEPKFSVQLIISKDDKATVKKIKEVIAEATEKGKSLWDGKIPPASMFKSPLKDGEEKYPDDPAYVNTYILNASSSVRPQVVDKQKRSLTSDEFYSGCYCLASLNFYPFNFKNMSKGVGCGLNSLLLVEEGDRLGGARSSANADFAAYFEADTDPLLD